MKPGTITTTPIPRPLFVRACPMSIVETVITAWQTIRIRLLFRINLVQFAHRQFSYVAHSPSNIQYAPHHQPPPLHYTLWTSNKPSTPSSPAVTNAHGSAWAAPCKHHRTRSKQDKQKKKKGPNGKILGRLHLIGRERVSRSPNNRAAHFRCCLSGAVIKQKLRHCGSGTCDDIHIHNRRTVIFQSISKKTLRKKVHLFILYVSSVYMRTTLVFGEMERN